MAEAPEPLEPKVDVMTPKLAFPAVHEYAVGFGTAPEGVQDAFGLLKCGVFVTLNAVADTCNLKFSCSSNVRKMLKSRLKRPGPRNSSRSEVPKTPGVAEVTA